MKKLADLGLLTKSARYSTSSGRGVLRRTEAPAHVLPEVQRQIQLCGIVCACSQRHRRRRSVSVRHFLFFLLTSQKAFFLMAGCILTTAKTARGHQTSTARLNRSSEEGKYLLAGVVGEMADVKEAFVNKRKYGL